MQRGKIMGLTLTQPWATLLAVGAKRFETRSWQTRYRGLVAIHASARFPTDARALCYENGFFQDALSSCGHQVLSAREIIPPLPLGRIIGIGNLIDCLTSQEARRRIRHPVNIREEAFGDFGPMRFAWEFEWAELLPRQIPYKGMLGLWSLLAEVHSDLCEQLNRTR